MYNSLKDFFKKEYKGGIVLLKLIKINRNL